VVDDIFMHPEKLFPGEEFEEQQRNLNEIRHQAVDKIGTGLHPAIRSVFVPS
jgi:hypothetical protein